MDIARKRISLSMRLDDPKTPKVEGAKARTNKSTGTSKSGQSAPITNSAMGNAFAAAFKKGK